MKGKKRFLVGVVTIVLILTITYYYWYIPEQHLSEIRESAGKPGKVVEKIAFESFRNEKGRQIYIMNPDGSNITRLTEMKWGAIEPAWSPNGKYIAFSSGIALEGAGIHIYVISVEDRWVIQLTKSPNTVDEHPAWSPDGKKIAFASAPLNGTKIGQYDIYIMNVDGSNLTRLTTEGGKDPCWSPDGKKIAFYSRRKDGEGLYIMNADGSNQTKIFGTPYYFENGRVSGRIEGAYEPAWSPDGKKIAFVAWLGQRQIFVIDVDGSNLKMLTSTSDAQNRWPTWSPDGKKIAFMSTRNGNWDIYIMNADGSNVTRLTDHPEHDMCPSWSP
jgi:Tol biopolymer transport system component